MVLDILMRCAAIRELRLSYGNGCSSTSYGMKVLMALHKERSQLLRSELDRMGTSHIKLRQYVQCIVYCKYLWFMEGFSQVCCFFEATAALLSRLLAA